MRIVLTVLLALALATPAQTQVGNWARLSPPLPETGSTAYDPVRQRLLLLPFGYGTKADEYWVLDLRAPSRWVRHTWNRNAPAAERVRATVYDPLFDRLLVFARDADAPTSGEAPLTVWALGLEGEQEWRQLASPDRAPVDRAEFALTLDTKRGEFLIFGGGYPGYGGPRWRDAWRLRAESDVAHWREMIPQGDSFGFHSQSAAVYDSLRDRMIVFGGILWYPDGSSREPSDELLTFDFADPMAPRATRKNIGFHPGESSPHCLIDKAGDRILTFSYSYPPAALSLADLSTWSSLTPVTNPWMSVRFVGTDRAGRQGIVVGDEREVMTFSVDSFSGFESIGPAKDALPRGTFARALGVPFPQGKDASVLYWGGFYDLAPGSERSLWRFSPGADPQWTRLEVAGDVPVPRRGAAVAYDGRRDRWLVYGGETGNAWLSDLWSFDPRSRTWTHLDSSNGPGALAGAAASYDGVRDRLLLFGGSIDYLFKNDTWALGLNGSGEWQRLATTGPLPHGRAQAIAAWEPSADRLVISGGSWWSPPGPTEAHQRPLYDTWSLPLAEGAVWDSVEAEPRGPFTRGDQFGWFNPGRTTIEAFAGNVLFGPGSVGFLPNDVRSFALEGAPGWTRVVEAAGAPGLSVASYDPELDRILVFNGRDLAEAFQLERGHPSHQVFLDVEPNDPSNSIQVRGRAPVTVAILGDPRLDPATVNLGSVTFAGAPALPERGSARSGLRDVNGDGLLDRLVRFDVRRLTFEGPQEVARLDGQTSEGLAIVGFDRVQLGGFDRASVALAGDPDAPMDMVRPLGVFASGFGRLRLDLPNRAMVLVETFGVNGRRVGGRDLGVLDAGSHDLTEFGLEEASAGVYFARVRAGSEFVHTKVIKLQ